MVLKLEYPFFSLLFLQCISLYIEFKYVGLSWIWIIKYFMVLYFLLWFKLSYSWGDVWLYLSMCCFLPAPCCYNLNIFRGLNFKWWHVCQFDKLKLYVQNLILHKDILFQFGKKYQNCIVTFGDLTFSLYSRHKRSRAARAWPSMPTFPTWNH